MLLSAGSEAKWKGGGQVGKERGGQEGEGQVESQEGVGKTLLCLLVECVVCTHTHVPRAVQTVMK